MGDNENASDAPPRTIWCPYTNRDIAIDTATGEHIIPLALGGHDDLTLAVDCGANSVLGTEVDGALANEFRIGRERAKRDVRGHSGREPIQRFKQVREEGTGRPLQVRWGKRLEVYDPIARRQRDGGLTFEIKFTMDLDLRLRFLAKCFLSAGYFVYGDWFRRAVQHWEPRLLMNRWRRGLSEGDMATMKTSIFSWYEAELADPEQAEEFETQKGIAAAVNGGVLVFMPGPENLGFFGGVLGQYLGMLNVPADTRDYPRTEPHDLGHVILVANGMLKRGSYRGLLKAMCERIPPEV